MRQMGLFIPESDWATPESLPYVPSGVTLGTDTETRDNGLASDRGPGWNSRDGHVAGFSVAFQDRKLYVPLRHPESENVPIDSAIRWLQNAFDRAGKVVFHNSAYDMGWLGTEGVRVDISKVEDTQHAEGVIDENRLAYGLDHVCKQRGLPHKDQSLLDEAARAFGLDSKKDLWRLPAKYVGPYAEQDASATLSLWNQQTRDIEEQGIGDAYRLEMNLVPCFMDMRRRGIRVNEDTAETTQRALRSRRDQVLEEIRQQCGWRRKVTMEDVNSPVSLASMFDAEGLSYPRTPKTKKGSFTKDWLEAQEHWLPRAVSLARKLDGFSEKFIGNYILGSVHLGRVHAEIHQLRDDDGGTRTYRLSYSNPPLQQIPARDALAPLIRGVFEPEKGELWAAEDYSQQEPRMAVHFAALLGVAGADAAVRYYCDDPSADFHTMVAELTGLKRKQAKIINLGLMYGMGLAKLAADLGVSLDEAREIVEQYNDRMPWVKRLSEFCDARAQQRGYIRLLDGARCRFPLWELAWRGGGSFSATTRERALALAKGRRIKLAGTHKAMNRLIQGSGARQTKMAMLACYREGLLPLLQMHDELDFSVSSPAQAERIAEIMQTIVPLKIPMKVDVQYGWTWGQASEEMEKGVVVPTFEELMRHGRGVANGEIVRRRT